MRNLKSPEILKQFELRTTEIRTWILDIFLTNSGAISHHAIELTLPQADRVTIYRNLKTFLEVGIIHKVLNGQGGIKYALCQEHCNRNEHHDNHVHFKCNTCGETQCVTAVDIPEVKMPQSYRVKETNMLIQGTCPSCNKE